VVDFLIKKDGSLDMDFLSSIPSWAWALIFIVGLVFVYGIFNRRWLEEERKEAEAQKKKAELEEPHGERVRAAELHVKDEGEEKDETKPSEQE
jgi:flagellar biosynthesis/type III secretory pathway M-ring protein FliF/YscJ